MATHEQLECLLTTCHCFSVFFPCACVYACIVPVYTYDATTQAQAQAQAQENGNRSILLCLCSCFRRCVVRVNRNGASISTSARTRRLCLRRTGLHVGFSNFLIAWVVTHRKHGFHILFHQVLRTYEFREHLSENTVKEKWSLLGRFCALSRLLSICLEQTHARLLLYINSNGHRHERIEDCWDDNFVNEK